MNGFECLLEIVKILGGLFVFGVVALFVLIWFDHKTNWIAKVTKDDKEESKK